MHSRPRARAIRLGSSRARGRRLIDRTTSDGDAAPTGGRGRVATGRISAARRGAVYGSIGARPVIPERKGAIAS